jgi:PAS domain S-box-containing protein
MRAADWQSTPFIFPLLLSGLLCAWMAFVGWRRRAVPGAVPFALLMAALAGWDLVNLVEKSLVDHDLRRAFAILVYPFIVVVPGAWLVFAVRFARQDRWLPPRWVPLLLIEPALILALAFTNSYHGLIHRATEMRPDAGGAIMVITHGPFFYVNAVYNYVLFAAGAAVLAAGVAREPGRNGGRLAAVLGAMLVPVLGNVAYVFGLQPRRLTDLTPVYFVVPALASAWLLFRVRIFDVLPIARDFVLDCLDDAVFVLDTRFRVLDANLAARALVPDPRGVRNRPLAEVLPELGRHLPARPGDAAKAAEIRLAAAGPERFWDLHVLSLADHGVTIGALVRLTEVTERKRAEAALRESELSYGTLARAVPGILFTARPDGGCDYTNQAFYDCTGMTPEAAAGDGWMQALHPDDLGRVQAEWAACVREGRPLEVEYRLRVKGGAHRWFMARGVAMRDADGRVVKWFGTCIDIDRQKQAEGVLREADRRKDEFLAMLAHELRNPLAPIRNALHLLSAPGADAAAFEQAKDVMGRQLQHLVRLVEDLLDVSRVMRGKIVLRKERVDLATVVARAVETAQPVIDAHGHELTVSLPPEPVWLEADTVRLAQVLGNLLTNAAKYTEKGGRIALLAGRTGDEVVLRVRDTGIGIEPEMLPRLFDLFVQADRSLARSQGGLGIGLALVRRLVEMHGGSVQAASEGLLRGSEFVVRLPAPAQVRQGEGAPGRAGEPAAAPPARCLPILVVDDNRDTAETLALVLRLEGHDVRVAHDGQTALNVARSHRPAVAFLDLGMPGMDGYELCRRMRAEPTLAPMFLVALTGYGQEEDRRRSREAGFDRHLVKPVEPHSLQRVLAHPLLAGPVPAGPAGNGGTAG